METGFLLSVNLNDDYDGGEISFQQYGRQPFRPPLGMAMAFSISLISRSRPSAGAVRRVPVDRLPGLEEPALAESTDGEPPEDHVTPPLVLEDQITPPPIEVSADVRPAGQLAGCSLSRR